MIPTNDSDMIRDLSYEIVKKVSPNEGELFGEFFHEYMREIEKRGANGIEKLRDVEIKMALSGEEVLQELLTPTIISAVIAGIKILDAIINNNKARDKVSSTIDSIEYKDGINFVSIERELFDLLRKWGIGGKRAEMISKEFVALIASDPHIIVNMIKK